MAFLAIPALGLSAGGTLGIGAGLLGAVGSVAQGYATQQAQEYNAKVLKIQALTAENQGASEAATLVDKTRVATGRAIAGGNENGVDFGGSWRDYVASGDALGHLDAMNAVYKGEVQGTGYRNQAAADIYAGQTAFDAGIIGAGTSMLKGFGVAYKGGSLDL